MNDDPARISPTAHYTSWIWFRNGMSHEALTSRLGRVLYLALQPMNAGYERFGSRPNLEMMLLARHRVLDHLLARAIESGRVAQVFEVAAGLSPRGYQFARRYQHLGLTYVEGDLPAMAARKQRALDDARLCSPNHHVAAMNALADGGPESLAAIAAEWFDPARGTAIVTEGLLGYFDRAAVEAMWARCARMLRGYPRGLYLTDLNLGGDVGGMRAATAFRFLLQTFARGKVHLHFGGAEEARAALLAAGFAAARLHLPGDVAGVEVPGADRRHVIRLVEAETSDH